MKITNISWEAIRRGDKAAFNALYQQYADFLYAYGIKMIPNEDFVAEEVQNLFVYLFEKRQNLSEPVSLQAYLCVSLKRMLLADIKKQRAADEVSLDSPGMDNYDFDLELDCESAIEQTEYKEEQLKKLQAALDGLSNQQRELIYLRFYKNLSNQEIAEVMNIKEQVVRNVISISLGKLRKMDIQPLVLFLLPVL